MSRIGRVTAVASLMLVVSLAASVFVLQRVDEARPAATLRRFYTFRLPKC